MIGLFLAARFAARSLALVLALVVVLVPITARAQQPADVDRAKDWFKAGATAYAAGDYLAAIQALDAAYRLTPLPAIAFSLAQAERRQYFVGHERDHLDRAVLLFRRYIDDVPSGGRRGDALDALSQLEPLAATVKEGTTSGTAKDRQKNEPGNEPGAAAAVRPTRVMIATDAPEARLSIDGGPPVGSPLIREVPPGAHRVQLIAPGFFPEEREVTAVAGELIPMSVALRERPSTIAVDAPDDADLYVDGAFVSRGGSHVALSVPSGPHRLGVAEKGRRVSLQQFVMAPGEERKVRVTLVPTRQRRIARALFVAGGVALGAGIVTSLLAVNAQDHAMDFLPKQAAGNVSPGDLSGYRGAVTERDHYRTATAVAGGLSAGLLVVGFFLYQLDRTDPQDINSPAPGTEDARPRAAASTSGVRLRIVPSLTGSMLGAVLHTDL